MLILPIKKKWFDMILSGEKKEEYREHNDYYRKRFANIIGVGYGFDNFLRLYGKSASFRVVFRNGYSGSSPSFIAKVSLTIGTGKEEWGAEPGKEYYVLRILEVMK